MATKLMSVLTRTFIQVVGWFRSKETPFQIFAKTVSWDKWTKVQTDMKIQTVIYVITSAVPMERETVKLGRDDGRQTTDRRWKDRREG